MTTTEYAALNGISESTVKNKIKNKELKAIKEGGKWFIISTKKARRIISPQEKTLRQEIKYLKQENKLLNQLREERDNALNEVQELRSKVEELHNKIHELNTDNQTLYKDVYGEMKALRITAKPTVINEDEVI